jgi:hypothetical protein
MFNKNTLMLKEPYNYSIYHDFIESYLPTGFLNINAEDPIMLKLEDLMAENDKMLIVMDLTKTKIIYTSKRSIDMVDVEPEKNDTLKMMSRVHPDDLQRFGLGRAKLLNLDKDLFIANKGAALLSTDIRMLKPNNEYANLLFQCYMFFSEIPHNTVYYIQVNTNIEWFKKKKDAFHYYVGNNISLFEFPNEKLLDLGHHLTSREFEIIKMISKGLDSKQISEKLFLSIHTINTHRRNILNKSKKAHISDYVYELLCQGLI